MPSTHTSRKPAFLITIDTEGDNLWSKPHKVTTLNAAFLPRFQALCERHHFRPTYLTNHEMATAPVFQEFGRALIDGGAAEIGMHLHAWDTPPLVSLTADDRAAQPYLIEYSHTVMREKIRVMTGTLEAVFGVKMLSHRAGRWGFDTRYAAMLEEEGYVVDCSVTPGVSWRGRLGDPSGTGGTDYAGFPDAAYWPAPDDLARPGGPRRLLEVPVTILRRSTPGAVLSRVLLAAPAGVGRALHPVGRLMQVFAAPPMWLRPRRANISAMMQVAQRVIDEDRDYAEFMLHSSEFMPGGSPTFQTVRDIERLYDQLETLFAWMAPRFEGMTLSAYRSRFDPDERRQ